MATVPVIEESPGFCGLDWQEINVDMDSVDTTPKYVCEECGSILFHDIVQIDAYLKELRENDKL